jgi:hypothetical protein
VGLERGPLSLARVIDEVSTGYGLEELRLSAVGRRWADNAKPLYPRKLELTLSISGGRAVGINFLRTKSHEVC